MCDQVVEAPKGIFQDFVPVAGDAGKVYTFEFKYRNKGWSKSPNIHVYRIITLIQKSSNISDASLEVHRQSLTMHS